VGAAVALGVGVGWTGGVTCGGGASRMVGSGLTMGGVGRAAVEFEGASEEPASAGTVLSAVIAAVVASTKAAPFLTAVIRQRIRRWPTWATWEKPGGPGGAAGIRLHSVPP
jgi:hypothetical protein